jgi:hypothetical protein
LAGLLDELWAHVENVAAAGVGTHGYFSGNPAGCVKREGAVFGERRTRVWVPPVGL